MRRYIGLLLSALFASLLICGCGNKAHIGLLLSALFASLLICGCGNKAIIETETIGENLSEEAAESLPGEVAYEVTVKINPEIRWFLDANQIILKVEYLNEDAKKVGKDFAFLGMGFQDALTLFLEKTADQGYLTNGHEVKVEVKTPNGVNLRDVQNVAFEVASFVSNSRQVTFDMEVNLDGKETVQVEVEYTNPGSEDIGSIDKETDASGNVISEKETFPDGSWYVRKRNADGLEESYEEYASDGTLIVGIYKTYLSISPIRYTETDLTGYTQEVLCKADGSIEWIRQTLNDGSILEEWWDNDKAIKRVMTEASGRAFVTEVIWNGDQIAREIMVTPEGVREETEYANGQKVSSTATSPDGEKWTTTYVNDLPSTVNGTTADGTIWSACYTNGVETFRRTDSPDGTYSEKHFAENGQIVYEEFYRAYDGSGGTSIWTLGANGLPIFYRNVMLDGHTYEVTYDGNGNQVTWNSVDADGSKHHGIFDAAGAPIEQ